MGQGVCSYHLAHEITHGLRRLVLHLACGVGVGAQGEARVIVAQHTGDGLDVHAVLQRQGCEGVPLWHNKDKSENPCGATGWRFVLILFPPKNGPKTGSAGGVKKQGCT